MSTKKVIPIKLRNLVYVPPINEEVGTNQCLIDAEPDIAPLQIKQQFSKQLIESPIPVQSPISIPYAIKLQVQDQSQFQVPTPISTSASTSTKKELLLDKLLLELSTEWQELIRSFSGFEQLSRAVELEIDKLQDYIYPYPHDLIFNAFKLTSFPPKVVILGQDPYHSNQSEAMGLSFSVRKGVKVPPSLRNIYGELQTNMGSIINAKRGNDVDVDIMDRTNGDLSLWAQRGVLLLNTALTVVANKPGSHLSIWSKFTSHIIWEISSRSPTKMVFMLWGSPAKERTKDIYKNVDDATDNHLILQCVHPSPLSASRGWFGSNHFSKANDFLRANGMVEIDWSLIQ
jgi:uracil-DNA glycosylase